MFSSLEEGDWYSFQGTDSVPIKIGCKLNGKGFYPAKLQYYEVSPFIGNGADFEVHPIKHLILKESCR